MDPIGIDHAVDDLTKETVPAVVAGLTTLVKVFLDGVHEILDRLNTISVVMVVPPRKEKP